MSDKKANIMVITIISIIFISWILIQTPIYINRNYSDTTYIITRDGLKGQVFWSTKFRAPLLIPKDIKLMAKEKIKLYSDVTLKSFFLVHLSHPLSDLPVSEIQTLLDEQDEMQRKFAEMFEIRGFENLKNLKPIEIDSIRFEDHQEPTGAIDLLTQLLK